LGIWSWTRGVIADRGEYDPIPIYLERSPEDEGYLFRLGVRAGFGGQETARVPVRRRPNPAPHPVLKEIHECEVAGQTLEAANVYALKDKVARLLEVIAPGRTLPLCYFRVPDMDYELPVYEEGGHIVCPVIGGPKLKARELAQMRRVVCQYLIAAGYVSDADDVEVGVVRPRDLRQVLPAAVFRSLDDPALWLPSVEGISPEGPVVGLVGHGAQLFRPQRRRAGAGPRAAGAAPAAPDVVALLRFVRSELSRARPAEEAAALYASEVRPEIWAAAEARTEDAGASLVAYLSDDEAPRLELAIRRTGAGDLTAALEDRAINVFLAGDETALAGSVGAYLAVQGFLRFATEVEIHAAAAPRAERLEADSIWTHRDGVAVAGNEPEEVPAQWS
jgi:hypothetical protein